MVDIVLAQPDTPPFDVSLVVLEEDRWLVLSASNLALPERRETEALVTEMQHAELPAQGELLVRGNRALAIVHDLESRPTFHEGVIAELIRKIATHCAAHRLTSIAMEPLGAVHGTLSLTEVQKLIRQTDMGTLERLWLIVPSGID